MGHIHKSRWQKEKLMMEYVKLICSFVDPTRAKTAFTEGEISNNDGFLEDLKSIDPNVNISEYEDVLEE